MSIFYLAKKILILRDWSNFITKWQFLHWPWTQSNYFLIFFSGAFPLSDVSLMTDEERERFLPATQTFVSVLEKPNLDQREIDQLIKESEALSVLIPESMREVISSSLSNLISARSGWKLSYIYTILHWYDINAYINYTSCHTINNIKTNIPMKIWLFFYYSKNSFIQLLYLLVPIITSQKKFCFYSRNKNRKGTPVFGINRSTRLFIMKKNSTNIRLSPTGSFDQIWYTLKNLEAN